MTKIHLGEKCNVDLERLIQTRLLVQANSGGGKSYLLRKLLEETHGKVQQIVLDLEGEFNTLREKYDYLLVGKEGDIKIDIRIPEMLANKLLELNVSTIIDLYELKHHERILFVRRFLDAMINAPKELWHPCIVIVDEAHQFCPEKGQSEAMGSVIDLMTRGRKRGYCGVLASQRLSKLHKDAAAEANNKLIGRTGLDVDMKRAGDELGFTSKADMLSLRNLNPGEFYSFGPAISNEIKKVKVGQVKTTHPKAGFKIIKTVTPPTDKIKQMLAKLTDLPQKAEMELKEKKEFVQRIRELERELRQKPKTEADPEIIKRQMEIAEIRTKAAAEKQLAAQRAEYEQLIRKLKSKLERIADALGTEIKISMPVARPLPQLLPVKKPPMPHPIIRKATARIDISDEPQSFDGDIKFDRCARRIYSLLHANPDREFTKSLVGVLTGYSHRSGGFNNALGKLNSSRLIIRRGDSIQINSDTLRDELVDDEEWDIKAWLGKLGRCAREIFKVMYDAPDQEFTKEELGETTKYASTSGGFNNALGRLNSLGLIQRVDGRLKLNEEVLDWI